jgi:hypothetical protein
VGASFLALDGERKGEKMNLTTGRRKRTAAMRKMFSDIIQE